MKYEYVKEKRKYKYGTKEKCTSLEELRRYVENERNKIFTKLVLKGYYKSIEYFKQEEEKDGITLEISIKYPVNIL